MYKLVIVDDESSIRTGLSQYFPWSDLGYEVVALFSNGLDAYQYIRENPVDALLCDIMMPKMTGLELMEKLNQDRINLPVILLTAYRSFDFAQRAITLGAKDYIVKPTRYQQIADVFSRLRVQLDQSAQVEGLHTNDSPEPFTQKIDSVIRYMRKNLPSITLVSAADYAGFNPNYFSAWFKQQTGIRFVKYLQEMRLEEAKRLLTDFSLSAEEISERIGFCNAKSMSYAFSKFYGISPFEYRNGKRNEKKESE